MNIWAFDPGAVATGLAYVNSDDSLNADPPWWEAEQYPNPVKAWDAFETWAEKDDIVLVETYRSGGHLTKEAMATIEIVGFLKYACELGWGWGPRAAVMRVEQHRLSGQREAAELMGDSIEALKKDPARKDAFSALAHACAYRRLHAEG